MKKFVTITILVVFAGALVFLLGPKPDPFNENAEVSRDRLDGLLSINDIGTYLETQDEGKNIRDKNYSQLLWADSVGRKTKYVLLYLHGFSASPMEGAPVHENIALRYGMNMYVPRLAEHGLREEEPMLHFTGEKYIESAKEALQVARELGDTVIIMSTSTGGTAALYLASADNDIHSLICYSPNIRLFDSKAPLLSGPWGLQIARMVKGGNYHEWSLSSEASKYWHTKYRLESLVELQNMIEGTMTKEVFSKVKAPTYIGYYFKDEANQDSAVSVDAILEMYEELGSAVKEKVVFPEAGNHCIPSGFLGEDIEGLYKSTCGFIENELKILPVSKR
ncbi:MAG: alpha/beta hydrolase [Bacteroidia bacterium]